MTRNALMAQNRPRVFDGRTNIKVLTRRIVAGNEIETAVVFVIDTGWIHETARTRGFESLGQLTNREWTKIVGQRDQFICLEIVDHLLLTTLVRLQESLLVQRDIFTASRVGISERRIRQHCFECAIPSQFSLAQHLNLSSRER